MMKPCSNPTHTESCTVSTHSTVLAPPLMSCQWEREGRGEGRGGEGREGREGREGEGREGRRGEGDVNS